MCLRRFGSASCLVVGVLLPRGGLLAQGPATPDGARPSWVSATVPWLLGQIIPNRLVPDPDPTRRRLVISYDPPPAERLEMYPRAVSVNAPHALADGPLRMGQGVLKPAYRAKTDEGAERARDGPMIVVSTENNMSAWFFLRRLAGLAREPRWADAAERIRRGLLQRAWNDSVGQFNQRETWSACCCGGCTKTTCIPSC